MKKYANELKIKKVWKQVRNQKKYGNKLKMELKDYKQRVIIEQKLVLRHLLSLF